MALPNLSPISQTSKVILPSNGDVNNVTEANLPFGTYISNKYWDSEQISSFKTGAIEQVTFTYKKLGGDVLDIELVDTQVYAAYEEACLEYSYLINLHQSRNALPYVLGQSTGSFDSDGQLTGSQDQINKLKNSSLAFPKMTFTYAKNIGMSVNSEVLLNGNEPIYSASVNTVAGQQDYDLQSAVDSYASANGLNFNGKRVVIRKVYYKTPGASWNFYGYFGGLNVVGNLSTYGQYADDSTFEVIPTWQNKLQAMAYEDAIKTRISDWSYELRDNKLRLFPVSQLTGPTKIWFNFTVPSDAWTDSNSTSGGVNNSSINGVNNMNSLPFQNLPYDKINSIGKQWIRRFALAICKEMLGQIRSKFDKVPLPGDSVTLNGTALIAEGKEQQKELREELKTLLNEMTYQKISEESAKMAEEASKVQTYIPNLIFVG